MNITEPKYFTPLVRCYSDGRVERSDARRKIPKFKPAKTKPQERGQCTIVIDKTHYLVHRIIASCFLGLDIENLEYVVDHRDGNPSNNRIENLRPTTKQGNEWNHVRAKGYTWIEHRKKWNAQIQANGKHINLGYFNTKEEARQAYLDAKLIYHVIPEFNFLPAILPD